METPSPRPPPRRLQTVLALFKGEASGGLLMSLGAAVALVWANSPWAGGYGALFEASLGGITVREALNDGLMTLFFFLVGLEIKRELVTGALRTPSRALLPLVAAVGGMVVPAGIYVALNAGTPAMKGWAIPMATDIAFALGCLAVLKGRVSHGLVVFLTALAIFDDIGGILVIALFYGTGLHPAGLLAALGIVLVLGVCHRRDVRQGAVYLVLGAALWFALHAGGVHATLAGVIIGLLVPIGAVSRFAHVWHGWVNFGIVPLFALANAGISLEGMRPADVLAPLPLGVLLGLFVGKQVGIFAFTWGAVKLGGSPMPEGAGWRPLHGVSVVAGIGFTVALFIAGLAFAQEPALLTQAKLGILLGSLVSAGVGVALLRWGPRPRPG